MLNKAIRSVVSLCLFAVLGTVQFVSAASSVWQISQGSSVLYLAGTIHMLRADDYPLPSEFQDVYQASDLLVFETDLAQLLDPVIQNRLQQSLIYPEHNNLRQFISDELYQEIAERWRKANLPPMLLPFMKPGGVAMTLTMSELQSIGVDTQGIDQHFHQRAKRDKKPVRGLESVDQQISYLATMGEGNEELFLKQSFSEMDQSTEFMGELIQAWRDGDKASLERLVVTDMQQQFPALYNRLLVDRNLLWLPQIKQMLKTEKETELVLVGAGHLVGSDGLLLQLAQQGYNVEQLR